jgi:hypothetical protein
MVGALILLLGLGGAWYAQPWGRTVDRTTLDSLISRGAVTRVWLTEDGVEGGVIVAPSAALSSVPALGDFMTPFFMPVPEGEVPEFVRDLRARGVAVDASWEIRRITELAAQAQARTRYYGVAGADVRSYALRLAELDPEGAAAPALLRKVGERMAWDAEVARAEGPPERAEELLGECLALVPGHPRCVEVSSAR